MPLQMFWQPPLLSRASSRTTLFASCPRRPPACNLSISHEVLRIVRRSAALATAANALKQTAFSTLTPETCACFQPSHLPIDIKAHEISGVIRASAPVTRQFSSLHLPPTQRLHQCRKTHWPSPVQCVLVRCIVKDRARVLSS